MNDNQFCGANGCSLMPVQSGLCIFHSHIDSSLWVEVTRFLQSPDGVKAVTASRKNRILWAVGLHQRHVNEFGFSFDAYALALNTLKRLRRDGLVPDNVSTEDEEALVQLKAIGPNKVWLEDAKEFLSVEWLCRTYEKVLISYVEKIALQKRGA